MSSKTYYEILGVPRNAGEREIKAAYHRLARKYHPDKAEAGTDAMAMEAEFSAISTAYNILKDKEKRTAYDQSLELKRQQGLGRSATGQADDSPAPAKGGGGGPLAAGVEKGRASVARRAYIKGLQYFSAGDYVRAAEFFEVAVKNQDSEASYHSKLAQSLLRGHRGFTRAIEAANRAIEIDQYNMEFRMTLAELYEAAGSKTMAVKTYEEIIKWDASNERARYALQELKPKGGFLARLFRRK